MDKLHLILDGDSWTFGSEILDPVLVKKYPGIHPTSIDWTYENDSYRKSKIFGAHLGEMLGADRITNLSWPADDNLTILRRTMSFIINNYVVNNLSTDNLFVVIGWTTPERTHFWFRDDFNGYNDIFRLRPILDGKFSTKSQEDFWKIYTQYIWNPEQYLVDYLYIVNQFQLFCDCYNIKWLCFNAFYQLPEHDINEWQDIDYSYEIKKMQENSRMEYRFSEQHSCDRHIQKYCYENIWNVINPIRFYKKNDKENTFKSYCVKNTADPFNGYHPSEISHKIWAKELYNYIENNQLNR